MMDPLKQAVRQTFFGLVVQARREQLFYICGSETLPPPLARAEEAELLLRNAEGDSEARDTLIEHNLRLVVYIARKFENTGMGIEDLVSIGAIGLIKAVHSFNVEKNIRLATYAARCIENEILMVLRRANRLRMEVSLDEPLSTDWDGNDLRLSDILGTEEDLVSQGLEADVERQALYNSIRRLDSREKDIVGLRYGLHGASEHTQKEVADIMGMSQSYISRIEKRIIKQLQTDMCMLA